MVDEITLVEQLQDVQTKEQAFRVLIKQYKERLYWHIRKIVISHDDADDVLQNVFVKVYRSIKNFKGDSKLYTWLYTIATNEAITFLNKRARQYQISSEELQTQLVEQLQSDVYFEGSDIQLKLQKAITQLPMKQQQVFQMKYFENIKYDDMSAILGTSVGALKSSYHIAVKKITAYLTGD